MTLRSLLAQHALVRPDALACIYLRDGELEHGRLTFGQLHRGATARAKWVCSLAEAGDRVLLAHPAGIEFLNAFMGCVYAGVIPVPIELPRRGEAGMAAAARIRAIAADCGARALLTSTAAHAYLPEVGMQWRFSDRAPDCDSAQDGQFAEAGPFVESGDPLKNLVYLQYTSGSTGEPKAVRVTEQSVAAQFNFHARQAARCDVRIFGSWLPHFHDFGLVGFHLSALALGLPHVFMAPGAFLARPRRWLEMISRYQVTYSGAPNFAYALCARSGGSEGLDLTSWRTASVGGEPVVPETLRGFARTFSAAGFDPAAYLPAYGLAEAGLCVAARQGMKTRRFCREALGCGLARQTIAEGGVELVGYGEQVAGLSVKVDGVGEIVVSSDAHGEIRTGDLGFLFEGDLYIAGRLKDVLKVRGRSLDPCDLERTAQEVDARIRPASTAVVQAGDEVLVLQEVDRFVPAHQFVKMGAAIAGAVASRHGVAVSAVVLLRHGSLPRTSSGKIRRGECRTRFVEQDLAELFRWRRPGVQVRPQAREYWLHTVGFQAPRMLVAKGAARLQAASGRIWRFSSEWDRPQVDIDLALTALFVLLHRWTGQTRLMVGFGCGGRMTPVLIDLANREVESDLAGAVKRQRLAAEEYADYTLEMLASELRRSPDAMGSPAFGATLRVGEERAEEQGIAAPLSIVIADRCLRFACQAETFSEADTVRVAGYYIELLTKMCAGHEVHPLDILMLPPAEEAQLKMWSVGDGESARRMDKFEAEGFERWAAREPDRIAVLHRGESLTYGALNGWADCLAERLRGTAGVLSRQGFGLVAGLVAGLKAGVTCVGLDPDLSALELRACLERIGVVVLCYAKEFEQLARRICVGLECELICLEIDLLKPIRIQQRGDGIERNIERSWSEAARRARTLELTDTDVVAQTAGPSSRWAAWQCTAALLVGGRVSVIEQESAAGLLAAWVKDDVTVAEEPAHVVREVLEERADSRRRHTFHCRRCVG